MRTAEEFHKKYTLSSSALGKGAYATVMLGMVKGTMEKVAVKKISKEKLKHRDLRKIHMEVDILRGLRHKNIVKVYDSYEDTDYFYMVMELIPGGELYAQIVDDKRRFSENEARRMIRTLLMTLKYCKDNGVVHRDLKPENILLTSDDELKLVDFNLAKQVDKNAVTFNVLETMCGTPNYVAPEIIGGTPYDYKCDVWSLGVISFLLLSNGYLPFFVNAQQHGNNAKDELLRKVRKGKWNFVPHQVWINVSDSAKDFVSKMLVLDPDERYGYEQLLAHPWQKIEKARLTDRMESPIPMDAGSYRKLKCATNVMTGALIFKELMEEDTTPDPNFSSPDMHIPIGTSGVGFFDSLGGSML